MDDCTIRPTMKGVWAAYVIAALIFAAGIWAWYQYASDRSPWLMAIPLAAFWPALKMHLKRRLITLRLRDDHLTLESGFFSRTRRTVDMAKIQDVTVRQTFGQRLLGTGDLMLESAGESGAMSLHNIDHPREVADTIIAGSKRSAELRSRGDLR